MPTLNHNKNIEVNKCIVFPNLDISEFNFKTKNENFYIFGENFRAYKNIFTDTEQLSEEEINIIESVIQKSDISVRIGHDFYRWNEMSKGR